jgi:SET domain-containing protein
MEPSWCVTETGGWSIVVRPSPRHGLGVFATAPFEEGDVIERCPLHLVAAEDAAAVEEGAMAGYVLDADEGRAAVAWGYGSLYNHDADPSATYEVDADAAEMTVSAQRPIAAGEEITIDYTGGGQIELWFDT